ncbi:MAG: Electron transfer flavoprotein alpha subunit, partial [Myxococcaceae bacterium]|nr:Electron transfer flavoprotein alpha subunit [Myxococcaceae bacterium]
MKTLVIAELMDGHVRKSTNSAITFAKNAGAPFSILVLGAGASAAAAELTGYGAEKVLVADDASLKDPIAERYAPTVAAVAKDFDVVAVTASSFGKDLAPRVAAKLDAGYAPDISAVKAEGGKLSYKRPMYAGNAYGHCEVTTAKQVVSVRQS